MSKNLVELMAKAVESPCMPTNPEWIAFRMLKVVKEHIGEVAQMCPDCEKGMTSWKDGRSVFKDGKHIMHKCNKCKGLGVIARTDEGSKAK